jgi:hypothetical protein
MCHGKAQNVPLDGTKCATARHKKTYVPREGTKCAIARLKKTYRLKWLKDRKQQQQHLLLMEFLRVFHTILYENEFQNPQISTSQWGFLPSVLLLHASQETQTFIIGKFPSFVYYFLGTVGLPLQPLCIPSTYVNCRIHSNVIHLVLV